MAEGDSFNIFEAKRRDGQDVLRLEFRFHQGVYEIRLVMTDDANEIHATPWIAFSDGPHAVEIEWFRAWSDTVPDGRMFLWIDDEWKADVGAIDDDTHFIDLVQVGAVSGIDTGTRGTLYFDGFVSRRYNYIGLDAGALPAFTLHDSFETNNFMAWTSLETDGGD